MRKIVLLTASLLCVLTWNADAQRTRTRTATSQGNWVLRLGMGYNYSNMDYDFDSRSRTVNEIHFKPTISYMVIDNLEIGATFNLMNGTQDDVTTLSPSTIKTEADYTDIGFGLFAQKYFPLNNWFAFYTAANLGISTGNWENRSIAGTTTTTARGNRNGVGGDVSFGFGFTPFRAFALYADIAGIGVQNMKVDPDGPDTATSSATSTTDIGFNVHRQPISLAIAWYFGRGLWAR